MSETSSFQSLIVWQKSMQLSKQVYILLESFTKPAQFAIADQMRRSGLSIPSNIAEGSGRGSNADYARFLKIAKGSCFELETQLLLSHELGYIGTEKLGELRSLCHEINKILSTLINKYNSTL